MSPTRHLKTPRSMFRRIMAEFAELTGLSSSGNAPRRYLWTDAFAVCNFLELYRQTRGDEFKNLALRLVNQVHTILGRHRDDDPRTGWISGLDEEEGKRHPTRGGLRIGKEINERAPSDPVDEQLEWDRDGQYFHYLTKWMHALNQVSKATGDVNYNRWAIELAKRAHAGFTYATSSFGQKRMYWKMSIDLSYPLVTSMGHHDPLDGFITYTQLQARAKASEASTQTDLAREISDMIHMCKGKNWATSDPLGIGGLLIDAFSVAQLIVAGGFNQTDLLENLLYSSLVGLKAFRRKNPLELPADYRLAFREMGLAIGLRAVEKVQGLIKQSSGIFLDKTPLLSKIEDLMGYIPLCEEIEKFWLEDTNREVESWTAHRDINMVMLATCLAPDGFLKI